MDSGNSFFYEILGELYFNMAAQAKRFETRLIEINEEYQKIIAEKDAKIQELS